MRLLRVRVEGSATGETPIRRFLRAVPYRLVRIEDGDGFRQTARDPEASRFVDHDGRQPQWRLLMAFDIVGFGRRDEPMQEHVRRVMYRVLHESFMDSEVPWPQPPWIEDRGDGVFMALPVNLSHRVMEVLVEYVYAGLRRHNLVSNEGAKFALRMALHAGFVRHDEHGLIGEAIVHLYRLLDGPAFKDSVAAHGSTLGLVVSQHVYDVVVRPDRGLIDPETFSKLSVINKETVADAWIRLMAPPVVTTSS